MTTKTIGVYAGGPVFPDYDKTPAYNLQQLKEDIPGAVFNTLTAWSFYVEKENDNFADGDISFNDLKITSGPGGKNHLAIVSGGKYVGPSAWPSALASLKTAGLSKIYFSTLGTFARLKGLIKTHGTGKDSILYQNFAALKAAIPAIDGIDLDDEDLYDHDTVVDFSKMLHDIGFEVSFCPYTETDFWAQCYKSLEAYSSGLVTAFNCQLYGNATPSDYIASLKKAMGSDFDGAALLNAGYYCLHEVNGEWLGICPAVVESNLKSLDLDLQGGWMYIYDSIIDSASSGQCDGASMSPSAYATALTQGLQSS